MAEAVKGVGWALQGTKVQQMEWAKGFAETLEGVSDTIQPWTEAVGGLYSAMYENKKQQMDENQAREIKAVQDSSMTEEKKNEHGGSKK